MEELKQVRVLQETTLQRSKIKAAIGIDGQSSDGKTGLALELAYVLAGGNWKKIYGLDAENNSMKLYAGERLSSGDVVGEMHYNSLDKDTGYSPFNYEHCQKRATELGCEVFIQDSYSHSWFRENGVLDMKTTIETSGDRRYGDNYRAWGHPVITEAKQLLFELIRNSKLHTISTLRIKDDIILTEDDKGKTKIQKVGLKQIQSDGLTYEFDLVVRMVSPGDSNGKPPRVLIEKSRYSIFKKGEEIDFTPELMKQLKEYLDDGTNPEEINKAIEKELRESIKTRAKEDRRLLAILKARFPEKKVAELNLKELRSLNSDFIEIEYTE